MIAPELSFHTSRWLLPLLAASLVTAAAAAQVKTKLRVPEVDIGVASFEARAKAQAEAVAATSLVHDFRFTDRQPESGITFEHRIVDDAGRHYKPVHYDHGNGVVVADVDGDGLEDLYFCTQLGSNQLWKNLGGGKFRNLTESAGVGLADRVGVTASFADIDNDGDADLFATTVKMGNALFENDGHGRFRDITTAADLDYTGHSSGAVFFDYDNDGLLDLFLSNVGVYTRNETGRDGYYIGLEDAFEGHMVPARTERSILYKNVDGKRFVDVSKKTRLVDSSWTGDATFTDLNGDLFPDLYVINMQGDDHYWENVGGERFVQKIDTYFPKTPWGTMGVKFFDFDNNGLADLYLTDMHSDMVEDIGPEREKLKSRVDPKREVLQGGDDNIFGNAFFVQLERGNFEERSDALGVENYWPWGLSTGDLNADGYEDIFVTSSMNYPFRYGVNSLFLNNAGQGFVDAEFVLGVEPRLGGRTEKAWFDLDCSGADKGHHRCGEREGIVTVVGPLGSRSSAIFDLDHDGDLDIVTNEFGDRPMVLMSDLADGHDVAFLKVRLEGKASNRDGLGATVAVTAGGTTYTHYHDGSSGYLSHSRMPLYFGLGKAKKIDRVEVTWPSGKHQVLTEGLKIGSLLEVEEPG